MEGIKFKKQGIQMGSGSSQRNVVYVSKMKNRNRRTDYLWSAILITA